MVEEHPLDGREQFHGANGFGEVIVHSGREAALAVFFPRACRQSDDRQVSPCYPLALPERLHDLEPVQLRHM